MRTYWTRNIGDEQWKFYHDDKNDFPDDYHYIRDFAEWNLSLTDTELARLAEGFRPNIVSPKKLKRWNPLDTPTIAILRRT